MVLLGFLGGRCCFLGGLAAHFFLEGGALAFSVRDRLHLASVGVAALPDLRSAFWAVKIDCVHTLSLRPNRPSFAQQFSGLGARGSSGICPLSTNSTRGFVPGHRCLTEVGLVGHVARGCGVVSEDGVLHYRLARAHGLEEVPQVRRKLVV